MSNHISNSDMYDNHASQELDATSMEGLVANAEEGLDMDQAIRHQVYIGWVLAHASNAGVALKWAGGNRFRLIDLPDGVPTITLVVPFPPEDWKP